MYVSPNQLSPGLHLGAPGAMVVNVKTRNSNCKVYGKPIKTEFTIIFLSL